jgi:AcrR family transcriptional regulator
MPRTKVRTAELRDRVLHVAMTTLATRGVGGFTTRRVAADAHTSTPAVYELFGDKAGLVREMFFEGFRALAQCFERLRETADPRADLLQAFHAYREFVRDNRVLAEVMFSRPFSDFDPRPSERAAGGAVRELITGRVRRCVDARVLDGDETDVAHALLALAQGLAAQENVGWLGTSRQSVDRRWDLAPGAMLDGLSPRRAR